ncbi:glycoside hydrolase family 61 protein [Sodiomyces alcalophilus JCM 7366]|uniref:glycoside hydrolase family 61 protein n=1 Tax=Sodiomyces alcalophilus JCM 7366 TaxID=591952 RepID=UPI0039B4E051
MKFSAILPLALAQAAAAHYIFPSINNSGNWQYVRQTVNHQHTGPIEDVYSPLMTCYELNPGRGPSGVMNVQAGSTVTFSSSPPIFHPGPAIAYLAKVPAGQSASTWDGKGAVWFKIWQDNAIISNNGISWPNMGAAAVNVPLPRCLENGQYLLRFEHIGLHSASSIGGAQLYLSCAQINVQGGSGGYRPAGMLSFPGSYSPNDPGLHMNMYWPVPTSYTAPGGPVGSC